MARLIRIVPAVIALVLALSLGAPAQAQAATAIEYQLQYAPLTDATGSLLIVTAIADPQLTLPVTITVPAPTGATLLWAGEILGGDPSADPARAYTVETVGDMDVYTLTLEQAYAAQLEFQLPVATLSGKRASGSLTWTNPAEEVLVDAAVVLGPGAEDVDLSPEGEGDPQVNEVGETLYPLVGARVAQGESYELSVEWDSASGAGAGDASYAVPLLIGLLVVAVVALVVVVVRERTRARRAATSEAL